MLVPPAVVAVCVVPILFFARRAAMKGERYYGWYTPPSRLMFLGGLPWDGSPAFPINAGRRLRRGRSDQRQNTSDEWSPDNDMPAGL